MELNTNYHSYQKMTPTPSSGQSADKVMKDIKTDKKEDWGDVEKIAGGIAFALLFMVIFLVNEGNKDQKLLPILK